MHHNTMSNTCLLFWGDERRISHLREEMCSPLRRSICSSCFNVDPCQCMHNYPMSNMCPYNDVCRWNYDRLLGTTCKSPRIHQMPCLPTAFRNEVTKNRWNSTSEQKARVRHGIVMHTMTYTFSQLYMCHRSYTTRSDEGSTHNQVRNCFRWYVCPWQRRNPKLAQLGDNMSSADTFRCDATSNDDSRAY